MKLFLVHLPLLLILILAAPACSDLPGCEQFDIDAYERITKVNLPPAASADCREEGPARLTLFQLDTLTDDPWHRFGTREGFLTRYNLQQADASVLKDYFPSLTGDPRLPTQGLIYFKSTLQDDYRYKAALLPGQNILIMEVVRKQDLK